MAFIGFGTFNKYYGYIFLVVICRFLCDFIEGFNEKEFHNRTENESFINFGSNFAYHPLFRDFFFFFGSVTCGLFFWVIYRKTEKNEKGELTIEKINRMQIKLLGLNIRSYKISLAIISLAYTINIILRTFLMSMQFDAGFWTLEILFVIYLSIRILKIKIGNHQKVTIFILAFILFLVQIISSALPRTNHHCTDEECLDKYITDNNLYVFMIKKFGNGGYIFLILFLYIFDFILRDISFVNLKYLMDVRSIPLYKIMLFIGVIGCCLNIFILIIVSNLPCNIIENIVFNNNIYKYKDTGKEIDFQRQVCGVLELNNNKLSIFYDNFKTFWDYYPKSSREGLEIFIIFFYFIVNFFINFSNAMILKHLDPNAMLVNINFNYFISRFIFYVKKEGNEEFLTLIQFILLEFCEILAIFAYMIYIELIELKFCKLDYHLKKSITQRGKLDYDTIKSIDNNDDIEDDIFNNKNESEKAIEMLPK